MVNKKKGMFECKIKYDEIPIMNAKVKTVDELDKMFKFLMRKFE